MPRLLALAAALALVPLTAPRPAAGDDPLADLVCALKQVEAPGDDLPGTLVEVEVRNRGAGWVEPLEFEFSPRGSRDARPEPVRVTRVLAPVHGRSGRAVAPGKRERYPLLVPLAPRALKGADVRVVLGSSWERGTPGAELELGDDAVRVGRVDSERVHLAEYGREVTRTTVRLDNPHPFAVDAVLEVRFRGDQRGRTLVREQLGPGAFALVALTELALPDDGERAATWVLGPEVTGVRLVDWSAVLDDGSELALAELRRAWDGWGRVDADRFPLRARFRARVELLGRFAAGGGGRFDVVETVDGEVVVEEGGAVTAVDLDGRPIAGGAAAALERALRTVAQQITRPAFDDEVRGWRTRLLRGGERPRVEISGAARLFGFPTAEVVLADGRVAGVGAPGADGTGDERWTTSRTAPDGPWRLDARSQVLGLQGRRSASFRWRPFGSGEVVDRYAYHDEGLLLDAPETVVVTFADWTTDAEPPARAEPPGGPLADRLRAAWDGFYRYPSLDARIAGTYRVTTPGTDGVWIGRTLVEGRFDLAHFDGGFWRHSTTTVDGEGLTRREHDTLANAVEDRLLMWSGRVPCWWPRFEERFAGATLADEGDGWIGVAGVPGHEAVRVADGRVVALRRTGGTTVLEWRAEADGSLLPVRVEHLGGGRVELDWGSPAPGWWFPTRARFTAIFGSDWGPETLDLAVESVGR